MLPFIKGSKISNAKTTFKKVDLCRTEQELISANMKVNYLAAPNNLFLPLAHIDEPSLTLPKNISAPHMRKR
ncbi:hypothetical protein C7120_09435 [Prevotella sp. oral taxon 376]|nr:hypothetical protein C7120_09435 [Prevotella sp. oral taxon 376]